MKASEGKRYLYVFKAALVGLLSAQIVGTVNVYLSNRVLHKSMLMVQQAGYLAVPNEHIWPSLQKVGTAFWGGLFFTLSIGTGLTLVSLICGWAWDRLFRRSKPALVIYLLLWFIGIGAVNSNGFSPAATAYLVIIPLVVFAAVLLLMPARQERAGRFQRIAFLGVPVLLVLVFLPLAKRSIFVDIRDTVLLSNSFGSRINNFYYDYTLFAAQAFKSLEQKTIRTCRINLAANESHRPAIENIFLSQDYLVIDGDGPVDLIVVEQEDKLLFLHHNKTVLTSTLRDFGANPSSVFQQFSRETDRYGPLRVLAFVSMAIGAPLCLYIIMHGIFTMLLAVFVTPGKAALYGSILCLFVGLAIALPLYNIKAQTINADTVHDILGSERWQDRVAGLRFITENELLDERVLKNSARILESPHVPERYWLVRALGSSKSPAASELLLAALDDPNTNVVTMAFFGLGKMGDDSVMDVIGQRIIGSTHWYEQWYAYRALRSLGWQQEK